MPLYKRGKYYHMNDRVQGRRIRRSLRTSDKALAAKLRDQIIKKALSTHFGLPPDNNHLPDDLKQHFMEELRSRISPSTFEGYDAMISQALEDMGPNVPLHEIRYRLNEYFNKRQAAGISGRTLNKTLELLRRMLTYGVETQAIPFNPLVGVPKTKERKRPRRPLTPDEIPALLHHSRKWRIVWLTFILTGMRKSELVDLRWKDLDIKACTLVVRHSKTDAGVRTIPLHKMLLTELQPLKEKSTNPEDFIFTTRSGTRLKNNLLTRFRECLGRAGIDKKGVDIHSLRYTFTSLMDRAGIPIKQTQTIAGHKSAVTTLDIYAKAYNEDLQDAVNSIQIAL